eukprot:scaffold333_cov133-Cylindrotheca_fusiformis.AAC.53
MVLSFLRSVYSDWVGQSKADTTPREPQPAMSPDGMLQNDTASARDHDTDGRETTDRLTIDPIRSLIPWNAFYEPKMFVIIPEAHIIIQSLLFFSLLVHC